jgi:hypothetical protein
MKGFRVEELINMSTILEVYGRNAADLDPRYHKLDQGFE